MMLREQMIDAGDVRPDFQAKVGSQIGLGVQIDKNHGKASSADAGAEVGRRSRFADTAFLIDDRYAPHGSVCPRETDAKTRIIHGSIICADPRVLKGFLVKFDWLHTRG